MNIALISFGHADPSISMAKYISRGVNLDLYYVFSKDRKRNNIIDFSDMPVKTGLQDEKQNNKLLSEEILRYIGGDFKPYFFIYYNLKFRSICNLFLSIKFSYKLRRYDIIHFSGTNGSLPWLIAFLFNKKLIFTIHDYYPHSGEASNSKFNVLFNKKLNEFKIYSKYPAVIQNYIDYQNIMRKEKKARNIFYIPFGPLEVYKNFLGKNLNVNYNIQSDLLFFGRICQYKGIEYLLEAFDKFLVSKPDLKLIIAGSGTLHFNYDFAGKTRNVIFLNRFIPSEELVQLITNTKVVVCPYTDATQSGVAMTAFALGKPVVASNVGGFSEIIEDGVTGYLVEPHNAEHLYKTLQKIFSDNDHVKYLTKNVENNECLSEKFQWKCIANRYINIYTKLLTK